MMQFVEFPRLVWNKLGKFRSSDAPSGERGDLGVGGLSPHVGSWPDWCLGMAAADSSESTRALSADEGVVF